MSFEHDHMAHESAKALLAAMRQGGAAWCVPRLTSTVTYWQGVSDWPRPDKAFEDTTTGATFAVEFKPPGQVKREYVTGLGQVYTYLRMFEYAALVLPSKAADGFRIGDYVKATIEQEFAATAPVALFEYETSPEILVPLVALRPRNTPFAAPNRGGRDVFWAYWRELSPFEVLDILTRIDHRNTTFNSAFSWFWRSKLRKGRARLWEGTYRRAKRNDNSLNSERANVSLSMRHIGLVDSGGHITEAGYELLRHGRIYGADSLSFKMLLGSQILRVGRHLDLIFWVEEQQRAMQPASKASAQVFYSALDSTLQAAGIIRQAPQGTPKPTFLRDEQKLWNKLGLLVTINGSGYFHRGRGLLFDWRAIMAMANTEVST